MSSHNPSGGMIEVLLSDLKKDANRILDLFKTDPIPWDEVHQVLHHIGGCAKLAKFSALSIFAEKLLQQADKAERAHDKRELIEALAASLESLKALAERKISVHDWEESLQHSRHALEEAGAQKAAAGKNETPENILNLFSNELEVQTAELNKGLLKLEHKRDDKLALQAVMRAAHSVKGAARVVSLNEIIRLAHLVEECFVAVQQHKMELHDKLIESLFKCIDFLSRLSKEAAFDIAEQVHASSVEIETLCRNLESCLQTASISFQIPALQPETAGSSTDSAVQPSALIAPTQAQQRALRVNAETLNRLMGLAGEALVESRWLTPFSNSLIKFKRDHSSLTTQIDELRNMVEEKQGAVNVNEELGHLLHQINHCQHELSNRLSEFDMFSRRYSNIAERLYHEVIESRMRPFSDITGAFPRMVRDLAKILHKKVRLVMRGENTPVDREILEKLEVPLTHLLRNSLDHGIELPEERLAKGKPEEGVIFLSAQHRAGMLAIEVSDDGSGVDVELLKQTIQAKQLANSDIMANLTLPELYEFMMLPGFSTASKVTEISGRGVGLSSVQSFVHDVGGHIRLTSEPGKGFQIHMILPLTLSVVRALLVEISEEPFAFPLAKIDCVLNIEKRQLEYIEQRPFFFYEGQNIGLISASEVLELQAGPPLGEQLNVLLISDTTDTYGVVVDRFMGEKELVVQELDPLLGKVPNISAGAFMEDGSPILILDVEDLIRTIDVSLSGGRLRNLRGDGSSSPSAKRKRILVVDDSITVREVECRLLENQGYEVETAVNGMDGWNALRTAHYDLVVTDVDMPRMNGIDFVRAIRGDPRFKDLPVMIVSYKERDEDRTKGLDAGANYYLTKSSFHDETLVKAVKDLIGEPVSPTY